MSALVNSVYQAAVNLWGEVKHRDEWVYCTSEGNLPHQGGRLQVDYLGRKRFAGDFLMFFDRDAVDAAVRQNIVETLSLAHFLKRRKTSLSCPQTADVLIVDHFMELGSPQEAITLAPHINALMPVMPSIDEQLGLVRSKGHRRKLQAAIKRGFTWRKTHSLADFNLFYDVMYEPFVHDRFRYGASLVPRDKMRHMFTHRGFLLLVEEEGVPVSGAFIYLSRRDRGVMHYWKYGLAHAKDLTPNVFGDRNAAQEACVLKYAVEEGFNKVDWGLTRAVPTDGIFTHKKRMGCDFCKTAGSPDFRILINPKSRGRLLSRFPLIISKDGGMHGIIAYEGSLEGRAGTDLAETLAGVAFASLVDTYLFVPVQMVHAPQLVDLCARVEQETQKPIIIAPLD